MHDNCHTVEPNPGHNGLENPMKGNCPGPPFLAVAGHTSLEEKPTEKHKDIPLKTKPCVLRGPIGND